MRDRLTETHTHDKEEKKKYTQKRKHYDDLITCTTLIVHTIQLSLRHPDLSMLFFVCSLFTDSVSGGGNAIGRVRPVVCCRSIF